MLLLSSATNILATEKVLPAAHKVLPTLRDSNCIGALGLVAVNSRTVSVCRKRTWGVLTHNPCPKGQGRGHPHLLETYRRVRQPVSKIFLITREGSSSGPSFCCW